MKTRMLVALGLFVLFVAASGFALPTEIKAKIDFSFTVEGKVLPPGQYDILRDESTESVFKVQGTGNNIALAQIVTRLAAEMHAKPQVPHLVFDMIGDTYALSEIWIPGEEGFAVLVTKAPHGHKVVKIMK